MKTPNQIKWQVIGVVVILMIAASLVALTLEAVR